MPLLPPQWHLKAALGLLFAIPLVYLLCFPTTACHDTHGQIRCTDYFTYYTGALVAKETPSKTYTPEAQYDAQKRILAEFHPDNQALLPYLYAPHATLSFVAFAELNFEDSFRVWQWLIGLAFLGIMAWTAHGTNLRTSLLCVAALLFYPAGLSAVYTAVIAVIMCLALLSLWHGLETKRWFLFILGIWLLSLKPSHLFLAIPLIWHLPRRWYPPTIAVALASAAAVNTYFGIGIWQQYIEFLSVIQNVTATHIPIAFPVGAMPNLIGWWSYLVGPVAAQPFWLIYAASLVLLLVIAHRLRHTPNAIATTLCLTTPIYILCGIYTMPFDTLLLIPPLIYLLKKHNSNLLLILTALCFAVCTFFTPTHFLTSHVLPLATALGILILTYKTQRATPH
jgi:hypothetical protein